jgi:serine protease Do
MFARATAFEEIGLEYIAGAKAFRDLIRSRLQIQNRTAYLSCGKAVIGRALRNEGSTIAGNAFWRSIMPIYPIRGEDAGRESRPARNGALSRLKRHGAVGVSALAVIAMLGGAAFEAMPAGAVGEQSPAKVISPQAPEQRIPSFAPLVERVKPAVVSIKVKADAAAKVAMNEENPGEQPNPFEGTPFEHFFNGPNSPFHFKGTPDNGDQPILAQGSGFFISSDGYIVTNNHVASHAISVEVLADNGKHYQARVIGTDPRTDLALLKVDGHDDFPYVKLSHDQVRIGDWVVAMGNPFGLGGTVTAGIVSARGRDIGEGPYDDFLQIDAPVNKGNSGGPTFNQDGEVIGVNTAIFSPSGGSVGIAFAIPSATVEQVTKALKDHGHVVRGWLGVQIQPVTEEIADSLGIKAAGAIVSTPQPDSPAEKAGLKTGDVILQVNGKEVKDARDLAKTIANIAPDTDITLQIMRSGHEQAVSLKLGELTEKPVKNAAIAPDQKTELSSLGMHVAPASDLSGSSSEPGLAVMGVDPGSKAAEAGLAQGDIILKVGGTNVSKMSDLEQALNEAKTGGKTHALALVKRNNEQHFVALPTGGVG